MSAIPARSPARRRNISSRPASAISPCSGLRRSSSCSTTCASRSNLSIAATRSTRRSSRPIPVPNMRWAISATARAPKAAISRCRRSNSAQDLRSEMLSVMGDMGVVTEKHHHEVGAAQHELGIKFGPLVTTADAMQIYKYVIHMVAQVYGKTACFMPKPVFGDNGSGMHTHQSIWKDGKPTFAGDKYADLSDTALHYIAGILKHAKALNAFTNPTTNSYKRQRDGGRDRAMAPLPVGRPLALPLQPRRPAGLSDPIHDHLAWGLIGLYRGHANGSTPSRRRDDDRARAAAAAPAGDHYVLLPAHGRRALRAHDIEVTLVLDPPARRKRPRLCPAGTPLTRRRERRGPSAPGTRTRSASRGVARGGGVHVIFGNSSTRTSAVLLPGRRRRGRCGDRSLVGRGAVSRVRSGSSPPDRPGPRSPRSMRDHILGARRLAAATGADLLVAGRRSGRVPHVEVRDAGTVLVGAVRITGDHDPGHRPEHVAYAVTDLSRGDEAATCSPAIRCSSATWRDPTSRQTAAASSCTRLEPCSSRSTVSGCSPTMKLYRAHRRLPVLRRRHEREALLDDRARAPHRSPP